MKIMRKIIKRIRKPAKGQSLVEMAIIVPILIFMMIGVFEVGWVLRSYLVMVNLDRELARFAIRPGNLNFAFNDPELVGYNKVLTHSETISGQLGLDFESNGLLAITHLVVDTGLPCTREAFQNNACDCDTIANEPLDQTFTYDDIILHPDVPGYKHFFHSFPPTLPLTITTGVNEVALDSQVKETYVEKVNELVRQNNEFNCEFVKKQEAVMTPTLPLETSPNNVIIVEVAHAQPQLFGFPVISNPFTDPVPLYAQTTVRLIAGARTSDRTQSINLVGRICNAYPWYVTSGNLDRNNTDTHQDVLDGWVKWGGAKHGETDEKYVQSAVLYPQMAMNQYQNTSGTDYNRIQVGSPVDTVSLDTTVVSNTIKPLIENLQGRRVIIPVLDDSATVIEDFVAVVVGLDPDPAGGVISATLQGSVAEGGEFEDRDADDHCRRP